ncbi:hypothetical protein [Endozoicomonas arenosclerae]|uniref:hypothetical protein n=1 Tax=Endozoicomonas arenosclerae TaxID=1633495 RepID=UPI0007809369|nr:hypothetical protein [Endozoicomonas arenosclerae]
MLRADLVFKGELLEKNEELSVEGIPYTFITYKVDQVIAGNYAEPTITLKYVGGTFANGNRLSATNTPDVIIGEQAILLVQKNSDTGCDLVECEHGRFLLDSGKIIAGNQSAIVVDDKGGVDYISHSAQLMGMHAASLEKSNLPQFVSHLKSLDKSTESLRKQTRVTVQNLDKNTPFKAYNVLTQSLKAPAVPKPGITQQQSFEAKGNSHDQWELEQLRKNGGNPVLSESYSGDKE